MGGGFQRPQDLGWLDASLSPVCLHGMTVAVPLSSLPTTPVALPAASAMLQVCYLALSVLLLLPLSLGVDGTDWGLQFGGWTGAEWAVLVVTSTAVYIGANAALQGGKGHRCRRGRGRALWLQLVASCCTWPCSQAPPFLHVPAPPLQHATWQLGAPSVSLFFGVRLVAAVAAQQLLLSSTVITSGVQASARVLRTSTHVDSSRVMHPSQCQSRMPDFAVRYICHAADWWCGADSGCGVRLHAGPMVAQPAAAACRNRRIALGAS